MKKIILALCAVFTFAIGANAQNDSKKERKQPTNEEMVKHQTDRMAERLDLNDKQKAELLKLNTEYFGKMRPQMQPRGPRKDMKKDGQKRERPTEAQMKEMRKKYEEGRKKYNSDLKKILTDEQFSKYEKMQQDMKKRRGQRDGRQGKGPRGRR